MKRIASLFFAALFATGAAFAAGVPNPANVSAPLTTGHCLQATGVQSVGDSGSACGGSGGTPGGSTHQAQYNNGGAFGGIPGLTWDGTTLALTGAQVTQSKLLGVLSSGTGVFDLRLTNTENLTAVRNLQVTLNDASRALSMNGNVTFGGAFVTSGAFNLTLTTTANTNVALPTSGTLATLAGTETFTNKSISGSTNTLTNIGNGALTNSSITIAGNSVSLGGSVTATTLTASLNLFTTSLQGVTPASGGGTTNFLRADGTWASPVGTGVTSVFGRSGAVTAQSGDYSFSLLSGSLAPSQCPAATASLFGCVKPDGTTLANAAGVLSLNLANANTWTGLQTSQGATTTTPGWYAQLTGDTTARVRVGLSNTDVASLALGSGSATRDTFIERAGAASLRYGSADAAAPVAQTLSVQNVVAGTTNTAGAAWTFNASQGTGTGTGGSFLFQVAPAGSTGSTQNAFVTALTIFGDAGLTLGTPTGGDKGAGTINTAGLYVNGVAVSTGGAPGGSTTQVQYNNAGAFGGISGATTNGTVMTLTAPIISGGQITGSTLLGVLSSGTGAFDLRLTNTENLTATRNLQVTLNDASRSLNMGGNITTAGAFATSGAFNMTLTATANSNATLPAGTHSIAPLDSPAFTTPSLGVATATSINGLIITTTTGTLTMASAKTATFSNTLTLAGTDGSTLNVGTGGTLGTAAFVNTGTSGGTVPLLNAANTWSGVQSFTNGDLSLLGSSSGDVLLQAPATGGGTLTLPAGTTTIAAASNNLSFFSSTTSAQLAALISDETGAGPAVFAQNPVLTNFTSNGLADNKTTAVTALDIDGSGRTLMSPTGSFTTALVMGAVTVGQQQAATNGSAGFGTMQFTASASGSSRILIGHSRATSIGSFATVAANDNLGLIQFVGDDGTTYNTIGAQISAQALNGSTISTGIIPGKLTLSVMNAAGTLTAELAIDDTNGIVVSNTLSMSTAAGPSIINGGLGTGGFAPDKAATTTILGSSSANVLDAYISGSDKFRLDANGVTNFYNGSASHAVVLYAGTILTGGTATTNFPSMLAQPTGTSAVTSWSTSGTVIGVNAPSGFSGNFIDLHVSGGASVFAASSNGSLTLGGTLTFTGTAPTVTGTGTPTIATGSTDSAGEVTSGTAATSVVITFATAKTNAPFCVVQGQAQPLTYVISTTAITITMAVLTGAKIDYICTQH